MLAYVYDRLQRHDEARTVLLDWVARTDIGLQSGAIVCNNLAWTDVMLGQPALLAEADEKSREALSILPWEPFAQGTRGAVLVEQNRIEEGLRLLLDAMKGNPRNLRAFNACYLAIAEARRGQAKLAQSHLARAVRFDCQCPLLPRARREVATPGFMARGQFETPTTTRTLEP
jgi:predicted Zn-dependent protease